MALVVKRLETVEVRIKVWADESQLPMNNVHKVLQMDSTPQIHRRKIAMLSRVGKSKVTAMAPV